jgi:hypothetical protein
MGKWVPLSHDQRLLLGYQLSFLLFPDSSLKPGDLESQQSLWEVVRAPRPIGQGKIPSFSRSCVCRHDESRSRGHTPGASFWHPIPSLEVLTSHITELPSAGGPGLWAGDLGLCQTYAGPQFQVLLQPKDLLPLPPGYCWQKCAPHKGQGSDLHRKIAHGGA